MKSYTLKPDGNSKIAAALCKLCLPGQPGEALVRSGCNQEAFVLFLANLAADRLNASRPGGAKTPLQLAEIFTLCSGGNASAARQALNDCAIEFEGEKPQSVGAYWTKSGNKSAAPNLSLLD